MIELSLVIVVALTGLIAMWWVGLLQVNGSVQRATQYRDRFERLVDDIESLVFKANSLQSLANQTRDVVLLDHYYAALRMIETLMAAVKNLQTFSDDLESLSAPAFLVRDIKQRLAKIEAAMERCISGRPHEFMKSAPVMAQAVIGCHFCSRPFDAALFGKVRVKVDSQTEEVAACVYCRERLLSTRKARVLFFEEDGVQVHWSKARSWSPSPEYWDINRDDFGDRGKAPHLELVYSNVSKISETSQKKD